MKESVSIEEMVELWKAQKVVDITSKPIGLSQIYSIWNKVLMKPDTRPLNLILPTHPFVEPSHVLPIDLNVNVNLHLGFKDYKICEWQTCNRVWRGKGEVGSYILHLEMQQVELDKINLLDLWKKRLPWDHGFETQTGPVGLTSNWSLVWSNAS